MNMIQLKYVPLVALIISIEKRRGGGKDEKREKYVSHVESKAP